MMKQSDIFHSFALFNASLEAGKMPRGDKREETLDQLAQKHWELLSKYD